MEAKQKIQLSSLDPILTTNVPVYKEHKIRSKEYISYGDDNRWPDYLWGLFNNVATLQSIINGTVDFICGDGIIVNVPNFSEKVNSKGETILDVTRKIMYDKMIFGGFALQIIRNLAGEVAEIYALDFMKIRSDEKNEIFFYCDDWSAWGAKALVYPKYGVNDSNPTSVFYSKGGLTRGVYPLPIYNAAIIPCEIEKAINEFHINSINNGFMSNVIINFNNGQPNDEQKVEIERDINEKYSGYQNASRILISYNDSTENATTVERLNSDDFDEKYKSLAERSRDQIFTAFRATPNLFGLPTETTGFSDQEYASAFTLYNRTVVKPIQAELVDTFDKIFGMAGSITIKPFTLNGENENEVN